MNRRIRRKRAKIAWHCEAQRAAGYAVTAARFAMVIQALTDAHPSQMRDHLLRNAEAAYTRVDAEAKAAWAVAMTHLLVWKDKR